jgi:hypothetical protein
MSKVDDLLQRNKDLKTAKSGWLPHWQEVGEIYLPRQANFTMESSPGSRHVDEIFDSTPMQARRALSTSVDALLKPKTAQWFEITLGDESLMEIHEVKQWLEETGRRLFRAMYNPHARFIQRSGEVDDELVTFGTGGLFIGESETLSQFLFKSIPLRSFAIAESSAGIIDTVFIEEKLTARQAQQRYGDKIGLKTKEALGVSGKQEEKFPFLQAIYPRSNRNSTQLDNLNFPWAEDVIDIKSEHRVLESGFQEFPCSFPRWDTTAGEVYGRSPAMLALGDSLTLQVMGETILRAGQLAVDPVLLTADDSVFGDVVSFPGGIVSYDAEVAKDLNRVPVEPLNTGANIRLGREMQNDVRDQVWNAFFRSVLQLPEGTPQMTATEVLERKEQFVRGIGPVFGRLETDYLAMTVERCFNIMQRNGGFADPPEILLDKSPTFRMQSPVERARKQVELAGLARSLDLLTPLIEQDPTLLDNFDTDEITRDVPDISGMPARWIRTKDAVAEKREARANQQQQSQQLESADALSNVVKNLGGIQALEGGGLPGQE